MATAQSHISFSTIVGITYACAGVLSLGIYPELALLSLVVVLLAGIIPNVDASEGTQARELAGLLAAIAPIALIEYYPVVKAGGMARIALVIISCYVLTRVLIVRIMQRMFVRRGMLHSIPAAVIAFESAYLIFWDLYWKERIFVAGAAFIGYFSHLLIDGYSNVDLVGKAMGKSGKAAPVFKFAGRDRAATVFAYLLVLVLGWFVIERLSPQLGYRFNWKHFSPVTKESVQPRR